ncbi:MAG: MerR family transcriptional regulator [Alphaproteobacteria bacterium]|nr:MerR family transcriptional regulator [Alphaproteobacteria bacterium]
MISIAEAAARTGLAASAIRYYEQQRLLSVPPLRKAGRRLFDAAAVSELALLADLRRAGMTLADIRAFQTLRAKAGPCSELSALATQRAKQLRAEILALRKAEERLLGFAKSCSAACGDGPSSQCGQLLQMSG